MAQAQIRGDGGGLHDGQLAERQDAVDGMLARVRERDRHDLRHAPGLEHGAEGREDIRLRQWPRTVPRQPDHDGDHLREATQRPRQREGLGSPEAPDQHQPLHRSTLGSSPRTWEGIVRARLAPRSCTYRTAHIRQHALDNTYSTVGRLWRSATGAAPAIKEGAREISCLVPSARSGAVNRTRRGPAPSHASRSRRAIRARDR
jgi:hypothetical protein